MWIVSRIAEVLASAIDCVLVIWFITTYFGKKKRIRWWEYAFWYILLFLPVHFISDHFNIQCALIVVVVFSFAILYLKGKRIEQLIACFMLCVLTAFINIAIIQIVAICSKSSVESLIVGGSILRIIVLCISKVTLMISLVVVEHGFEKKHYFKREEYIFGAVLYFGFFILVIVVLRIIGTMTLSFQIQMDFLLLTILLLAINSFIFWMIKRINNQNRYELENEFLKVQLEQQKNQISYTEQLYQSAREMRHDLKHYFTTYLQLLKAGETDLVIEEMEKTLKTQLDVKNMFYMKSKMINAVINQKATVCEGKEILFEVQITVDYQWENESNIAILISNLLDNAIEAELQQKEKKMIQFKMFSYKENINIIVKNYIAESVLKKNPNLRTTKHNKSGHGIGMESVREIVRQEDGTMDVSESENYFIVHILLPEKKSMMDESKKR